jgi:hypothetical protein
LVSVSRRSLICLDGTYYSVPCAWAELDVTAHIGPNDVLIVGPTHSVLRRRGRFGERVINYLDYLPELARKPQAVRQVAAELLRDLGEPFGRAWRQLVDGHGPGEAARIFAKLLGYVDERGLAKMSSALERALQGDAPLLLALAPPTDPAPPWGDDQAPVGLRLADVEMGRAADYDRWLVGGEA